MVSLHVGLSDVVFPSRCAGCARVGPSPCGSCIGRLVACGAIELGAPVDAARAVLEYDALARRLVSKLKYGGVRTGVAWFAEALAAQARALREPIDEVTWVPARPPNRRRRGFDQAEALACAVGEVLGTPASATLLRHADGGQTGRSRIDRLAGPALAPAGTTGAPGATVLVVDDVATTGATLRTAAALLKESGAGRVVAAVVAHPRGPRSDLRTSLRGPGGSTVGHPQTTQGEGAPWT